MVRNACDQPERGCPKNCVSGRLWWAPDGKETHDDGTEDPVPFSDEVLDQLLANYTKPEDLTGKDGILKQLTARLVERRCRAR
jgi:hypothetical protein